MWVQLSVDLAARVVELVVIRRERDPRAKSALAFLEVRLDCRDVGVGNGSVQRIGGCLR